MTVAEGRLVEYERRGSVAVITFNRPEKLNAMSDELAIELSDAMRRFDQDDDALVAVLNGRGRAFSSGADVHQRQLRPAEEVKELGGLAGRGANTGSLLTDCVNWKPVVAAVHGYTMGMALGIAIDCEMVVASEDTRFQLTEVGRGLGGERYYAGMHYRGAGTLANDVGLTGRFFTAREALEGGLINRVVPAGTHLEAAIAVAEEIAANPPLSVRAIVRWRRIGAERAKREADLHSAALKLNQTEDFRESALAFAEKRKPAPFKGR
ncbi:MAG: enoyl-CoA hydratase/isomerase family protein [Microbacteriaceae bacterium]|nr:enoyl-CoA hydratase/isomerase family protein [Microbacteriaceae bacterium]